jgi:TonB family protein
MVLACAGVPSVAAQAQEASQTAPRRIYRVGDPGMSYPVLVREVSPSYTSEGLRARLQGVVALDVIIEADGSVSDVQVADSLDRTFGLDQRAIEAAKLWRFEPARFNGQPVRVRVRLELEFRLRPQGDERQTARSDFEAGASLATAPGVRAPIVKRSVQPSYTAAAMEQKIQGVVSLDVVVMPDGRVDRVRVVRSLNAEAGLDDAAVAAARRWVFEPGTLNGVPVPVIVRIELEFRLR